MNYWKIIHKTQQKIEDIHVTIITQSSKTKKDIMWQTKTTDQTAGMTIEWETKTTGQGADKTITRQTTQRIKEQKRPWQK